MYNCDEKDIIKLDADFDEDFYYQLIDIISNCKRIYFLDQKGFGMKAIKSNSKFNKSVDLLPEDITHIKFGHAFNQRVDNLPFRLEWLEFGHSFDQSVDMLPNTITYLVFGHSFNQPVNDLSNSLEYISFGKKFNQSLDNLPNSIFYINIGSAEYSATHTEFAQHTYNLPLKLENILIYFKRQKYPVKNNFVFKLNELVQTHQIKQKN